MTQRVIDLTAAMPSADRARRWLRENVGDRRLEIDIPRLNAIGGISLEFA